MTWAVYDTVNLRYMFFYHDGTSGQRASNDEPPSFSPPPPKSLFFLERGVSWWFWSHPMNCSLSILSNSTTCYQWINQGSHVWKEEEERRKRERKIVPSPISVVWSRTTELMTDGWTVISWLVTWEYLLDSSSVTSLLLLGSCHSLCLVSASGTPRIGIAFYRTSGSSAQSDDDASAGWATWLCVSWLNNRTLVERIDETKFVAASQHCQITCRWLQISMLLVIDDFKSDK
jgi:hypothetical protein